MSADDQQERLIKIGWIVGFVDGEGCFSVSIFRNKTSKLGWQVFPEFAVTQGSRSLDALKVLKDFFKCGNIVINHRNDNHKEDLYRFLVRNLDDLKTIIIPFFQNNRLRTAKSDDFNVFTRIIGLISERQHLTHVGLTKIAKLTSTMNRKSKSKYLLESSETTR